VAATAPLAAAVGRNGLQTAGCKSRMSPQAFWHVLHSLPRSLRAAQTDGLVRLLLHHPDSDAWQVLRGGDAEAKNFTPELFAALARALHAKALAPEGGLGLPKDELQQLLALQPLGDSGVREGLQARGSLTHPAPSDAH
jgi:hypothetical protein